MRVYQQDEHYQKRELDQLRLSNTAVALGVFDAMHLGHQAIIRNMVSYARAHGLTPMVYLFRNLPRNVIAGEQIKNVNLFTKRLELLEECGVEVVAVERFTPEYQKMTYEEFIDSYLVEKFGAKYVCAGYNYHFGYGGEGNAEKLKQACTAKGIVVQIENCMSLEHPVSSSYIRELITNGKMEETEQYLGRKFSIEREVTGGNQIGRKMGFPTANLILPGSHIVPKFGVYISEARIGRQWYMAITNVGGKPTVEEGSQCIETHILDYSGDLYGEYLEVRFCKFLRGIMKFESIDALADQLERDKQAARAYFSDRL